jgi:hypothetical protein
VQRPYNLHEAYWLARRFEQSYPFKKINLSYSPFPVKSSSVYKQSSGNTYNKNNNYKPVKAIVTPIDTKGENISTTRNNNKCFRCNEK